MERAVVCPLLPARRPLKKDTDLAFLATEIIKNKRDGKENSTEELEFFLRGYLSGEIADYQMSAWLMAVVLKGMSEKETVTLMRLMLESGATLDFSHLPAMAVDKHSTGGVGDKTSLILAPIVAALGLFVPMVSGRGLGHTGGTLDKLESIPGFETSLDVKLFCQLVEKHGLSFMGQTAEICPADKKIYGLRDVTGTVESLPLICASIMSKKVAEGIDGLVLDIKCGSGAFMKDLKSARKLANGLVRVGKLYDKKVSALITQMDQPLGRFIGNSLEVAECVSILRNDEQLEFFSETKELSLLLASHMALISGKYRSLKAARVACEMVLSSGKAYEKFQDIVKAQGGDLSGLPSVNLTGEVRARTSGWLQSFETEEIGRAAIELGAGRRISTDKIDATAGIEVLKKVGSQVKKGDLIYRIYGGARSKQPTAIERLERSFLVQNKKTRKLNLLLETI